MKKIILVLIFAFGFGYVFVTSADAEILDIEVSTSGDLKKINDSKYKATAISVLRDSDGQLLSVIKTSATRYLDNQLLMNLLIHCQSSKKEFLMERI